MTPTVGVARAGEQTGSFLEREGWQFIASHVCIGVSLEERSTYNSLFGKVMDATSGSHPKPTTKEEEAPLTKVGSVSLDVVKSLGRDALRKVYGGPGMPGNEWTVRGVMQMLPEVAQQYVLRLACAGSEGVTFDVAERWGGDLGTLEEMGMIDTDLGIVKLFEPLRENVVKSLAAESREPWVQVGLKPAKVQVTPDQLKQWMIWKWNNVLFYVVGDALTDRAMPDEATVRLLREAELMAPVSAPRKRIKLTIKGPGDESKDDEKKADEDDSEEIQITGSGLEFLLKPRLEQVWILVEAYIEKVIERQDKAELISLILSFAYCRCGTDYPTVALTPVQRKALKVLGGLGLVFQRTENAARFYPTQLGIDVAKGEHQETSSDHQPVDVVVQTNFQVIAYTDSAAASSRLIVAVLSLFASLRVRLPNLVVGDITRTAVKACVAKGIRVSQITNFLESHAHPVIRAKHRGPKQSPLVPPNVLDQMLLWGGEEHRVLFHPGILVTLDSAPAFDAARYFAASRDAIIFDDSSSRRLFLTSDCESALRSHLRDFLATGISR